MFHLPSEEVAISAAKDNYNHYNLPFSHILVIVIISDEDMLGFWVNFKPCAFIQSFFSAAGKHY